MPEEDIYGSKKGFQYQFSNSVFTLNCKYLLLGDSLKNLFHSSS